MRVLLAVLLAMAVCSPALSAEEKTLAPPFRDVPADHWAAAAVKQLAEQGILRGYEDSTFRGDRPVTRYELAAALARFAEFIQASRKPVAGRDAKPQPAPAGKAGKGAPADCPAWARSSIEFLTLGQFLPGDSPIILNGTQAATAEDLAQGFASLAARLIELETPAAGAGSGP